MERGDLRALYVIGENPATPKPMWPTLGPNSKVSTSWGARHSDDPHRGDGRRGAARLGSLGGEQRHRYFQRASGAAGAPRGFSPRPGSPRHRHLVRYGRGHGFCLGPRDPEAAWDELRSLSDMHGGMAWERLEAAGGLQWPCPDEDHPGSAFLHGWLWADDLEGRDQPRSRC